MIYILLAITLRDAFREGFASVLELLWAICYGFLLEWIAIKQLHAYHYGHFLIMLDNAPLCIAVGWAVVIYSSMRFSNRIQLPDAVRPILDALMGLQVDLALDVIAIRLGLWTWQGVGSNQQWFGVPWANFGAWFVVIWSYSGFIRALRPWQSNRVRRWLYPPVAMLLSLAVLVTAGIMYGLLPTANSGNVYALLFLLGGSLITIYGAKPTLLQDHDSDLTVTLVPIVFHSFAIIAGIGYGIFGKQPILGVIGITVSLVGIAIHTAPRWIDWAYR